MVRGCYLPSRSAILIDIALVLAVNLPSHTWLWLSRSKCWLVPLPSNLMHKAGAPGRRSDCVSQSQHLGRGFFVGLGRKTPLAPYSSCAGWWKRRSGAGPKPLQITVISRVIGRRSSRELLGIVDSQLHLCCTFERGRGRLWGCLAGFDGKTLTRNLNKNCWSAAIFYGNTGNILARPSISGFRVQVPGVYQFEVPRNRRHHSPADSWRRSLTLNESFSLELTT